MKKDLIIIRSLVKRGIIVFLRDKASVFFSLLAPLIVFFLYVTFLGDLQVKSLEQTLIGVPVSKDVMRAFVDGWMIAGVMGVACITVSFSANNIMVQDKARGVLNDAYSAPVKRGVLRASYFVYNFLVSTVICMVVLAVCLVYLTISGWYLSIMDVFATVGHTLLSVLSASLISVFLTGFLKSEPALGAIVGIMSAAIGFLCGAYFPLSMLPKFVQYAVLFIPGTYSAGVFRNLFMGGAYAEIAAVSGQAASEAGQGFSMNLDFFGSSMSKGGMLVVLLGITALCIVANIVYLWVASRKKH